MGKSSELLSLLKTGNSDAARRLIAKLKKAGKKKAVAKELNVPDDNGQTVIHFCAAQNFVEFLQDLAELGASIDLADNKGYTPLHLAAASGRTSAVTALINMGADPNISSRTGDTALHLACHSGHATSVESLVSENANCTMLNVSGHTPLDLACQGGHAQVVSLLLRSGQFSASYLQRSDMPHTALVLAAKQGHNECIGLLVKHGFDVNRKLPGGNSGTALHEAALNGRVDTVRYLLQYGVDVQQTNAQGHTALEIVNMYADPRTASVMKQVLQDALAQQARTRIAQHHSGQQAPPTSTHHTPPTAHRQPSGFSYFSHPGSTQPAVQRQVSGEHSPKLQRQQQQIPGHQPPAHAYRQSSHTHQPMSHAHQSAGHTHQPAGHTHQHMSHAHQPTGQTQQPMSHAHQPTGHTPQPMSHAHQPTGQTQQPMSHAHQPTGHTPQPMSHAHQPTGQTQQPMSHAHQPTGHTHQHMSHAHQPTGHTHQPMSHTHQPTSQTHGGYHAQPVGQSYQQPAAVHPPSTGAPHSAREAQPYARDLHSSGQLSPSMTASHVQHIYPKPGTPEAVRKAPGIGGDLASIIAAKAASRKPIVTSPTRREFGGAEDERFTRSMTVGGEPAMQEARSAALRRRSSMSDRSSGSPEHAEMPNVPTLPRRTQAGPPSFKPIPPPADDLRPIGQGRASELQGVHGAQGSASDPSQRRSSHGTPLASEVSETVPVEADQRQRLRRPQPKALPPPTAASVDNELMAKLMRRQNKITEAEQVPPNQPSQAEAEPQVEEEEEEEEEESKHVAVVQQKPPPPPQRRTPSLNTQPAPPPPSVPPTSVPAPEPAPSDPDQAEVPVKPRKSKPPPPKPKEAEPEMSPWQQELASRKARLAENEEPEPEPSSAEERAQGKPPSPLPTPKQLPAPAPKPKRKEPPSVPALPQEQPPIPPPVQRAPIPPPQEQPPIPPPVQRAAIPPPQEQPPIPPPVQRAAIPPPQEQPPIPPPVQRAAIPPPQEQPPIPPPVQRAAIPSPQEQPPIPPPVQRAAIPPPQEQPPIPPPVQRAAIPSPAVAPSSPMEERGMREGAQIATLPTEMSALAASSTDQLSRSTSLSSLTTTGTGSPQVPHMEHMPIAEWLTGYKLGDYIPVLKDSGYETTELLVSISHDELQDMGITKIGHRKKLISALANWPQREPFFHNKPESVSVWLSVLRMSQYEQTMLEAGYDDIDFVCDITVDDLQDIGISKRGHVKRLLRGIGELTTEVMKSGPPIPSVISVPPFQSAELPPDPALLLPPPLSQSPAEAPPHSNHTVSPAAEEEPILPPPFDYTSRSPEKVDFSRMKGLLERKMGVNRVLDDPPSSDSSARASRSPPPSSLGEHSTVPPAVPMREPVVSGAGSRPDLESQFAAEPEWTGSHEATISQLPPKLPPKKSRKSSQSPMVAPVGTSGGNDAVDGRGGTRYTVEDISTALGEPGMAGQEDRRGVGQQVGQDVSEFDQLSAALQGFDPETGQSNSPNPAEPEPDQLLADIDDMLADLSTHLDFMIPDSAS